VEGIGSALLQPWLVHGDDPTRRQRACSQQPTNAWLRATPLGGDGAITQCGRVLTPILKQFAVLTIEDFAQHPVWIACHVADDNEPWYDDTDEETFRPYVGELPVDVGEMTLVAAQARLNDGSRHFGFLTPAAERDDLATVQPHVFAGGRAHGFWGGIVGVPVQERQEFLDAIAKAETVTFPIEFVVSSSLSRGITSTTITGWPALTEPAGRPRSRPRWLGKRNE
jgi:hypothetical protein